MKIRNNGNDIEGEEQKEVKGEMRIMQNKLNNLLVRYLTTLPLM
jgi:hypothetical protein